MYSPNTLTIWEAQFGDFANGAQIMIDNIIQCGEAKWDLRSGLVINLPHGYDGQGAEHSSGRIERFLQATDSDYRSINIEEDNYRMDIQKSNLQIVYCTTPANQFHVLRRQVARSFRKPLINFFSKKLLRHPECISNYEDILGKTKFTPIYDDLTISDPSKVEKLVLCSGQI